MRGNSHDARNPSILPSWLFSFPQIPNPDSKVNLISWVYKTSNQPFSPDLQIPADKLHHLHLCIFLISRAVAPRPFQLPSQHLCAHRVCPTRRQFCLPNKKIPQPLDLQRIAGSTPDWIRTSDLQSRSLTLYPTELRARVPENYSIVGRGCQGGENGFSCRRRKKRRAELLGGWRRAAGIICLGVESVWQ